MTLQILTIPEGKNIVYVKTLWECLGMNLNEAMDVYRLYKAGKPALINESEYYPAAIERLIERFTKLRIGYQRF